MKVKSESEVAQSCPPLSDPMDDSLPGSSVRGIFQAGVLEWVTTAFSKVLYPKKFFFYPKVKMIFSCFTFWKMCCFSFTFKN